MKKLAKLSLNYHQKSSNMHLISSAVFTSVYIVYRDVKQESKQNKQTSVYELQHEKTCLQDFRPGPTQTGLCIQPQRVIRGMKFQI